MFLFIRHSMAIIFLFHMWLFQLSGQHVQLHEIAEGIAQGQDLHIADVHIHSSQKSGQSATLMPKQSKLSRVEIENATADYFILDSLKLRSLTLSTSQFHAIELIHVQVDTLIITDCEIDDRIKISNCTIGFFQDYTNTLGYYDISETVFHGFVDITASSTNESNSIESCRFKEGVYIGLEYVGTQKDFILSSCQFDAITPLYSFQNDTLDPPSSNYITQVYLNLFGSMDQLIIEQNRFPSNHPDQLLFIEANVDFFYFTNNFSQGVLFPACTINQQLYFAANEIKGEIVLEELFLGGNNNIIEWESLNNNRIIGANYPGFVWNEQPELGGASANDHYAIFKQTSGVNFNFFRGKSETDLGDDFSMQKLISSYYRLYSAYKSNGQILSANRVYIEMKDHEQNRYRYLFKHQGGLEYFFQWQLSRLLRSYTRYGTDPSRAILVSIGVILGFAIFYFFFPSEWDTKSKAMLINDFKTFIRKNKYGYIKPFFKLMVGFFLSLLNAIALSLNSFVTLGFGTIPTAGPAKYVCIAQGFIGWFLLSIFTASLINQVMF